MAAHRGPPALRLRRRAGRGHPPAARARRRPRCYGFDLAALRPIADRIGPTPEDLGQDPSLTTDPADVRAAKWWLQEYKLGVR